MARKEILLSDDTVALWEQLVAVFKDGKVEPKEVPVLIKGIGEVLEQIAESLAVLSNVDPKVKVILMLVASAAKSVAASLDQQSDKLIRAWGTLSKVMRDGKITPLEAPTFIGGLADLLEAIIAVLVPFLHLEFTEQAKAILRFVQKIAGLFGAKRGSAELKGTVPR